jgi:hypothetical protein
MTVRYNFVLRNAIPGEWDANGAASTEVAAKYSITTQKEFGAIKERTEGRRSRAG